VDDYGLATYGQRVPEVDDEWRGGAEFQNTDTDAAVAALAELAGDGRLRPAGARSRSRR